MNTRTKSALILLGTLALGGVLGAFVSGTLAQQRRDRIEQLRGPGGFVAHMERVIEPRDEAQRSALRPILEATDQRNREAIRRAEEDMRVALEDMIEQVDAFLDDAQRERLTAVAAQGQPPGAPPGAPPRGGPQGRPPPGGPQGGR